MHSLYAQVILIGIGIGLFIVGMVIMVREGGDGGNPTSGAGCQRIILALILCVAGCAILIWQGFRIFLQ